MRWCLGCLKSCVMFFFFLFALLIAIGWLKGPPKEQIREEDTVTRLHAREVTPEETSFFSEKNAKRLTETQRKNGLISEYLHLTDPDLLVEMVRPDSYAGNKASEPLILTKQQARIQVQGKDDQESHKTTTGSMVLGLENEPLNHVPATDGVLTKGASFSRVVDLESEPCDHAVELEACKTALALVWLTDTQDSFGTVKNPVQSLHLKLIDLQSGTDLFSGVIRSQKYGLRGVVVCYHPLSDSLAFAWEDISKPDNEMLYFAVAPVADFYKPGGPQLKPFHLFPEDQWQKRSPKFIKSGKDIFLSISTGDNYGFFAYSGKPSIGISILDRTGKPSQYGLIGSEWGTRGIRGIRDQTIFYNEFDSSLRKNLRTRAIDFKNVYNLGKK